MNQTVETDPALDRILDRVRAAIADRTPLDIRGGGTKRGYGGTPVGAPLDIAPLTGISSYEPTELVLTARAGTPLADLEATLAERGQCLPFEPPRWGTGGTVGGMVAAGLAGPARAYVGGVRDYVLGATLLNGQAEVLSFGGQVMKNVAGYDVSRTMAGSMGVLGILLEVSLKVLPRPKASATLVFELTQVQALDRLWAWARQPLPINATLWLDGRLWIRFAGAQAAVHRAVATLGGQSVPPAEADAWWDAWRDHRHPFLADLPPGQTLWRLSLPSTAAVFPEPQDTSVEWGGAQRWWRTDAPASTVQTFAQKAGGHATRVRGPQVSGGGFAPLDPVLMQVHRRLKAAFDPLHLFNPGRLYPDL